MKTCSSCKIPKEFKFFSKNKAQRDGLANQCKSCFTLSNKKTRIKNKDKIKVKQALYWAEVYKPIAAANYLKYKTKYKDYKLKTTFGITLNEYELRLKKQNNCCAICNRNRFEFNIDFAVDHCHITGKVRGLLCSNCNNGLGRFKDSVETIVCAASYLAIGGI